MKRSLIFISLILLISSIASAEAGKNPIKGNASLFLGRDNNTKLNADRKADFFSQQAVSLDHKGLAVWSSKLRLSSDVMNVTYFEANDQNVLLVSLGAGLDTPLNKYTTLQTDYTYDIFYFPDLDSGTSSEHSERVGLSHKINESLHFKWGADFKQRGFEHRALREATGVISMTEREDTGYGADTQLIWKISKKAALKTRVDWGINDSNDQFHDYYDYELWKVSTTYVRQFYPKLIGSFKFSYANKDYDSRPLRDDATVFQEDDTYTFAGNMAYRVQKNISLALSYTYRENHSSEPSRKYSGSLTTLGLTYSF